MSLLIKGASILGGAPQDVRIVDGFISEVGTLEVMVKEECIQANGLVLLPGFVDLHTHVREPGREDAETIDSASRAAVIGGYTAVSPMANTHPVADTAGVVEQVLRLGQETGRVDLFPIGAVTRALEGKQLSEIGAMADSSAHVRIFSDDGKCVFDPLVMRRALEYVKRFDGIIAQHAQEPRLTEGAQMNEGALSAELGLAGWPAIAEESIIARDILIAEHVGSRLHICHLTTAGGVELVRWAKARGVRVTAEVTPHHLLLTDESARGYDATYKVNPPLRTESDVLALRAALIDGTIDVVATDHAPHPSEDKECEWQAAAFGMLGLESALGVVIAALTQNGSAVDWPMMADRMSIRPAAIAGYVRHGQKIAPGSVANLVLINPSGTHLVDRERMASKSKNTPYDGMTLPVQITHTIYGGVVVMRDGVVL
jgi:dihydroorotase